MATQSLANLDPTGTLSTAGAAVGLVGAVLRTVPAIKNATNAIKSQSTSSTPPETLQRAYTSVEGPALGADLAREKRAYETVNFVLRELGTRICAAGLVNEHALGQALTAATQHVEVNLFSGETNRLFASLAPKLADLSLVTAVFTSIYFIGALTAELARSLPNYKESYTPLGPWIVQQLFRTAIGEDAFRDNLTANLDAYKTVAATAGLLRPTDIGYSSFPGFPAFTPTRYSSRSYADVRNHRNAYDKLVKHFDKWRFPRPLPHKQAEVGPVTDWRFLAGDSPSRFYDVEKADKNIGQTFGQVVHWLICSADRLPHGQAVIAYYLQHIELIKWIGQRMGYSILYGATDFDLSGAHGQLDKHCRAIFGTWVILMPSEMARATRRASSATWAQTHMTSEAPISPLQIPQPEQQGHPADAHQIPEIAPLVVPIPQPQALPVQTQQPQAAQNQGLPSQDPQSSLQSSQSPVPQSQGQPAPQPTSHYSTSSATSPTPKSIDEKIADVARNFREVLVPQCEKLSSTPPADPNVRLFEYRRLTHHIEKNVIGWLDGFPIPDGHPARISRKEIIIEAQQLLQSLDIANNRPPSAASSPPIASTTSTISPMPATAVGPNINTSSNAVASASLPAERRSVSTPISSLSHSQQLQPASPPPYSPNIPPSTIASPESSTNPTSAYPFPTKKPIRRKAPPPPAKKVIAIAKALYDFEPEEENDEELAFKEGDDMEIVEKSAALEEEGWCKARVKGAKKVGLVPLEYLEVVGEMSSSIAGKPAAHDTPPVATASTAVHPVQHELHGSEGQTLYGTTSAEHTASNTNSTVYAHPSPSSHPATSYPNDVHLHMTTVNNQGAVHHASKAGKKLEVAGLAVATAGAGAGIASYFQQRQHDSSSSPSSTQPVASNDAAAQQGVPSMVEENVTVNNEQYGPRQDIQNNYETTGITQNNDPTNVSENNYANDNNNTDPTTILQNSNTNNYPTAIIPPFSPQLSTDNTIASPVDLSTYSSYPFDSQPPLLSDGPNPIASVAAVDPYFASQTPAAQVNAPDFSSFLAAATAGQATPAAATIGTSPFAGMATATVTSPATPSANVIVGVDDGGYDDGVVADLDVDSDDGGFDLGF